MMLAVYTGSDSSVAVGPHRRMTDHDVLPGDLPQALVGVAGIVILDPLSFPFEALRPTDFDLPIVVAVSPVDEADRLALGWPLRALGPGDAVSGLDLAGVERLEVDASHSAAVIEAAEVVVAADAGRKARRRAEAAALRWVLAHEARTLGVDVYVDVDGSVAALGWPPEGLEPAPGSSLVAAVRSARSDLAALAGPGGRVIHLTDAADCAGLAAATLVRSVPMDPMSVVVAVAT